MSSINGSQISKLMKDIADLRKADAREATKEANLLQKLGRQAMLQTGQKAIPYARNAQDYCVAEVNSL